LLVPVVVPHLESVSPGQKYLVFSAIRSALPGLCSLFGSFGPCRFSSPVSFPAASPPVRSERVSFSRASVPADLRVERRAHFFLGPFLIFFIACTVFGSAPQSTMHTDRSSICVVASVLGSSSRLDPCCIFEVGPHRPVHHLSCEQGWVSVPVLGVVLLAVVLMVRPRVVSAPVFPPPG
jgi:hypothetical protein